MSPACRRAPEPSPSPSPAAAVDTKRYPLTGRVVSLDRDRREATIAHDEIPGFMMAMTMLFPIRDGELPAALQPGVEIVATLAVAGEEYWLEGVAVRPSSVRPMPSATPAPRPVDPKPGDTLPDVALVDQDGRKFRLSDYRGRALAVTFLFTRCPLPDFCPRMAGHFSRAQELIAAEPALLARTRLLAVSFDTEHDKPAVLKAWGARYQKAAAGPPFVHWTFASGEAEAVRTLALKLGLFYEADGPDGFTHSLRSAVVGPDLRLVRLFPGNEWRPEELVKALREVAARAD